jgi:hypothetical protein
VLIKWLLRIAGSSADQSSSANLETVLAGGGMPRIADRQGVSAPFSQGLYAALTAGKTTVKLLHAVLIG